MWVKVNEVNYLAVSSQRVQISERRLNICKPSKERVGACKDYVIGREITSATALKKPWITQFFDYVTRVTFLLALRSSDVVSAVINESARSALECALRCECRARKKIKSL